ncbi:hypothetical protein Athai_19190 [Actinocatenispora thailandica]|uniref:Cobyric acid synthase n=1 Tax=Actinocatenispora thailandica TaxID=227318 RepID=A0A7R7HW63_9ACTN|nr:hypothetical protein Athai_19190 [Actinocatenispora thailandica]
MTELRGALLVAGTTSDAGKSTLVAGLCRYLRRRGVRVAPFKAQNMSNNSAVTLDGGEIGRAQAWQAAASGLEPSVRFNPVLLKPGSDRHSQLVVLGRARGEVSAGQGGALRAELGRIVAGTLDQLRAEYDVVICEGAGSPAEINLRSGDLANMGLARSAGLPTIVVGDIDRGGVFASMFGTLALLEPADQRLVAGFVVNKFRGDAELLAPGLSMLTELTGRPTLGVLPYEPDLWWDTEDSLSYSDGRLLGRPGPARGEQWLRIAVVRLPRISNATDLEALAAEPGVSVRLTATTGELADADLIVLPGSKATVADLEWLRERGLDAPIRAHAAAGRPVLGLCGGYQMLGALIDDPVESGRGQVDGLGLLPVHVRFVADKKLGRVAGTALAAPVRGYEIHHGRAEVGYDAHVTPLITDAAGAPEGCRSGAVFGTHWHGAFDGNEFRRAFLAEVARLAGRDGFRLAPDTDVPALREASLDRLGDLVEKHLDGTALDRLIGGGAPAGLPFVPPGPPPIPSARPGRVLAVVSGTDRAISATGAPPARPAEPVVTGGREVVSFERLAAGIRAAPARCGPVRLVAVDGRAGSGKSTFAARLTDALAATGARVFLLHTDDLLQGWLDIVSFWPRLEEWVLCPLRRGEPARFRRYDWHRGAFPDRFEQIGRPDVLVLDGVTTARAAARPLLTRSCYVQTDRQLRFDRGCAGTVPGSCPTGPGG